MSMHACPEDMIHVYNGLVFSHKKNEISFEMIWLQLEIVILSEVRKTNTSCDITYTYNLKHDTI